MIRRGLIMYKGLLLMLTAILLWMGCGSSKKGTNVREPMTISETSESDDESNSVFMILTGEISYDSLKSAYSIEISDQTRVDGFLNLEGEPISESDAKGLNYVQLTQDSSMVSIHSMENPLVQSMEYHDGPVLGRKTVIRSKAALFLRVQLSDRTAKIAFRNGNNIITVIKVEK